MSDQEARQRIANQLEQNLLVEAAAGTGKTTCIVDRMVNLVAEGVCPVQSMAAVTFTRKAAAELRERFRSRLVEAAEVEPDLLRKQRLEVGLADQDQAFLGTFHSFCALLLRERPIEFGVQPGFRELEEEESAWLREQAWHQFLDHLRISRDPRLLQLESLGLETSQLRSSFERMLQYRDVQDWPAEDPGAFDWSLLVSRLQNYSQHMQRVESFFPLHPVKDGLAARYRNLMAHAGNVDWTLEAEVFEFLEWFDCSHGATQKEWQDPAVAKQECKTWNDFREDVVQPAMEWWKAKRYAFLIPFLQAAKEVYLRVQRNSGGLDFQDLLLTVASGLREQSLLRSYFARRFTHLLVDEFQDTDPVQAEILTYLCAEGDVLGRWQDCRLRPGSLFVVGDPKQSIYRFRRADIVAYQQIRKLFTASGGQLETLSRNFRTVAPVRNWINCVFRRQFTEEGRYSPAYVELEEGRNDGESADVPAINWLEVSAESQNEVTQAEAEAIAGYIQSCLLSGTHVNRPAGKEHLGSSIRAADFLVLTRNKGKLLQFSKALDRLGIPNEVSGCKAFEPIRELTLLRDCVRAADDSRDPVALVSILRSELFGFSDAELYEYRKLGGKFSYTQPVPEQLPAEVLQRWKSAFGKLLTYQGWLRRLPFTTALSRMVTDLGLLARSASHDDGAIVAGGLLKALEWVRAQSHDFDSTMDALTCLEQLIGQAEADSWSAVPGQDDRVRLMNVHKAKGLQAPVVILADCRNQFEHPVDFHVDRSGERARAYFAMYLPPVGFQRPKSIAQPRDWDRISAEEQRFENAEEKRLLYVACTRAENQLVVLTHKRSTRSFWQPLCEFLDEEGCAPLEWESVVPEIDLTDDALEVATHQQAGEAIEANWARVKVEGYHVQAVKESSLAGEQPRWQRTGDYGVAWGTALHQLLEAEMRPGADRRKLATDLCAALDIPSDRAVQLVATVQQVCESDVWQRALRAKQCYVEVPVDMQEVEQGIAILKRGVIDLCFLEDSGWVMVDYKTDSIGQQDLESASQWYANQLRAYAKLWQEASQQPVKELGIYFTLTSQYRTVSL